MTLWITGSVLFESLDLAYFITRSYNDFNLSFCVARGLYPRSSIRCDWNAWCLCNLGIHKFFFGGEGMEGILDAPVPVMIGLLLPRDQNEAERVLALVPDDVCGRLTNFIIIMSFLSESFCIYLYLSCVICNDELNRYF